MKNKDLYFPRYIPVGIIHPIVKEYCDNRDMGYYSAYTPGRGARYSAVEALAFESGLSERQVADIYRGTMRARGQGVSKQQVEWKTVDKLLTAMDLSYLWYQEPLSAYYNPRPSPSVLQSAA